MRICLRAVAAAVFALIVVSAQPGGASELGDRLASGVDGFLSGLGEEFNRIARGTTRTTVDFPRKYRAGEIVVSTKERRLCFVVRRGRAYRYAVGVGRDGFTWGGVSKISRKAVWPGWRPPAEMRARQPGLPEYMPGGPNNPLGARAIYLGDTLYRIHGTRESHTIGTAISSGCIRMLNNDVIDLYDRVRVGAKVYVYH